MVSAMLDGRKSQTRRALKLRPARFTVGDHLWVREAWRTTHKLDAHDAAMIAADCHDAGYSETWLPI